MTAQEQADNVEYFNYFRSMTTTDARCTREIKSRIAMEKAALNNKLDLNLRKKLVKCYIWTIAFYGAETWTLQKVDQKQLGSFEMWCWKWTEKISWTDRVRNEEVLPRVNEKRNIPHRIKRRKANWIGYILRRNCFIKRNIEGKIEGGTKATERQK